MSDTPLLRKAADVKGNPTGFEELGDAGLSRSGGYVQEEWLRELRGIDGVKRLREMIDNCPITGAILYAIKHLARGVTWDVEAVESDNDSLAQADFIRQCLFEDQSQPWQDVLSEILTFLPYGWAYHEVVLKYRGGETDDPTRKSRFDDGRIGLRKMPLRAQETLSHWSFDESGGVQGMVQQSPNVASAVFIPIEKALLFRTETTKGNPEGRSILRNGYISYVYRKRIEAQEGIGIERDLAGYPVFTIGPEGPDIWNQNDPLAVSWRRVITKLYKSIRRDEQEGMIKPHWLQFELMSAGSRRQFDTSSIIERFDRRIAMTVLWDFILLGHGQQGSSYALVSSRSSLAAASLQGFLDSICSIFNRFLIPKLLRLNGMPTDKPPQLKAGAVEAVSITELGAFMQSLSGAGFKVASLPGMMEYLFSVAKIPVTVPDDWEEQMDAKAEAELEATLSAKMKEAAKPAEEEPKAPNEEEPPPQKKGKKTPPPVPEEEEV